MPGPPEPVKLLSIFHNAQTSSAKYGASYFCKGTGKFSSGKLVEKNAKEGSFPRFPGLRFRSGPLAAVLPAATLPIGRRFLCKNRVRQMPSSRKQPCQHHARKRVSIMRESVSASCKTISKRVSVSVNYVLIGTLMSLSEPPCHYRARPDNLLWQIASLQSNVCKDMSLSCLTR